MEYTNQQNAALAMIQNSQVGVMTGAPGTGKTTATLQILEWAKISKLKVFQASPTGRAAKRMMEATNYYASTIHSMLGCEFVIDHFEFIHNQENPLPADLIILDEISMITNDLMARVMEAIDINRTKLLLIGDADQLPSVGAGAVLRDLLLSGVIPSTELDIIHRNSGDIVTACHGIKNGKLYTPAKTLNLDAESPVNLIHVNADSPESALEGIKQIVCELIPKKYGFNPIDDVQVISPVNSKGLLSCDSINGVLRDVLNPVKVHTDMSDVFEDDQDQDYKFRAGDKVINTKNTKAVDVCGKGTAIVNGDIGIVQFVAEKEIVVLFSDPDRKVKILKKEQNLLHAYCITCHRFQGSEAPVIIIPVHNQFNYFLSNSWIYTAISRAKVICITVGNFGTVERAIRNRVPNERVTMLKERLIEAEKVLMDKEFGGI